MNKVWVSFRLSHLENLEVFINYMEQKMKERREQPKDPPKTFTFKPYRPNPTRHQNESFLKFYSTSMDSDPKLENPLMTVLVRVFLMPDFALKPNSNFEHHPLSPSNPFTTHNEPFSHFKNVNHLQLTDYSHDLNKNNNDHRYRTTDEHKEDFQSEVQSLIHSIDSHRLKNTSNRKKKFSNTTESSNFSSFDSLFSSLISNDHHHHHNSNNSNNRSYKYPNKSPSKPAIKSVSSQAMGGFRQYFEQTYPYEKGPYADEILNFLDPFFSSLHLEELKLQKSEEGGSVLEAVVDRLRQYADQKKDEKEKLMKTMNVKRLLVPYIELNLPGELILLYNELEEDDPRVILYQTHPLIASDIRELGVFLDRYDTNKEVLCLLVWSKVDDVLVNLPSIGLNPYPLCWQCCKSFGMNSCGRCGVAKYCSRECQLKQWPSHKIVCSEMAFFASKHKQLCIT